MSDVTQVLSRIEAGDRAAPEELLPLVYEELRKLAAAKLMQERPGQTLQATALVHEAYLRLVGTGRPVVGQSVSPYESPSADQPTNRPTELPTNRTPTPAFDSRGHFFAAAAEAMRRILIEQARRRESLRRGGGRERQPLDHVEIAAPEPSLDVLALDDALERFTQLDPQKAQLVKLRYFAGLTLPQVAQAMGISDTTADRYWAYARAWLHAELKKGGSTAG
jgi:RNA polymerase sigma factor (sigma-70 family)